MDLLIKQRDGSIWSVPVLTVAFNRAEYYKDEFDGSVARSLKEDTLPLFEDDAGEITDWAMNNMNWKDVEHVAHPHEPTKPLSPEDFQQAWLNWDGTMRREGTT